MKNIYILPLLTAMLGTAPTSAQNLKLDDTQGKETALLIARNTLSMDYTSDISSVAVTANCDYTVATNAEWLQAKKQANGNVALIADYYYETTPRKAEVTLTSTDKKVVRQIAVEQKANTSADFLKGDEKIAIASAKASQYQGGENIERTYDGDVSTLYHSPYYGTTFPVTLTYNFSKGEHVDYLIYTPRQSQTNGNFGQVTIEYALASAPATWVELYSGDFKESSSAARVDFGEKGMDDIKSVRFTVKTGAGGFASCAEMGFFQKNNELTALFAKYFSDELNTQLRPNITEKEIEKIPHPYVRQLAHQMLKGYDTKYRVGKFSAFETLSTLSKRLKTSNYNKYENATGIYFTKGEKIAVFVKGIDKTPVSLIIKSFGPSQYEGDNQNESSYVLQNGVNIITAQNRGNGYLSYYTDDFETAPEVEVHFAMGQVNGYFDLERGDTNEDWKNLITNAKSDIIDIVTPRMHMAALLTAVKERCPENGVKLATLLDSVIYCEREIMGLQYFNKEPKNRQFARPVTGGIYADGIGAALAFDGFGDWVDPENLGYWGLGHELGHVNQVRPGFKWDGCGETTNNIYSAWVLHTLGKGYHNLEDEHTVINETKGWRGGRFNAYLEEGVRQGKSWQLQEGPDYFGSDPQEVTVATEDYDGNKGEQIKTTKRNYDHFVKVIPFYQLTLYTEYLKKSPVAFGKVIESIRKYTPEEDAMSNGKLQMKFMRSFCDSTKMNFLPFFEKAGMLRPIAAYIEDYSPGWIMISQEMIDELKAHVTTMGYAEVPAGLNFLNAYNIEAFRNSIPVTKAELNTGCTPQGTTVRVDGDVWKNAVGYETYDAEGNLLHLSMFGLGEAQQSKRYTKVLFPSNASYIMAVGYDGEKVKCYQK